MKIQFRMLLLMIEDPYRLRHFIQAPRTTIKKTIVLFTIKIMIKMKVLSVPSVTRITYPNNASLY